ncbi:MAG TPA: hypothetical protein VHK69_06420, partial [Chitinophagaceae bacterium]|nr:hypothetical protein [Chitinophagaceae bacterium]
YSAEQGVEYYSGYDGGEYWSEGDRSEDVFLTGIPEGDYVLQLQGLRPFGTTTFYSGTTPAEMRVLVLYDMPMWSNLLVCLIPALLWLGGWYLRVQHNENRRWANSPFSPEE